MTPEVCNAVSLLSKSWSLNTPVGIGIGHKGKQLVFLASCFPSLPDSMPNYKFADKNYLFQFSRSFPSKRAY